MILTYAYIHVASSSVPYSALPTVSLDHFWYSKHLPKLTNYYSAYLHNNSYIL